MKKMLFLITALFILQTSLFAQQQYAIIKLDGSVNPVISDFIIKSIKDAQDKKMEFIVIQMDTPGGLMSSMRDIIKAIMNSNDVPIVVYTYPKGAQAASAGGFIMLSAHIAVMSPGTEIGAMHPVSPQLDFSKKDFKGAPDGIMEKKVLNDTIAFAKSIAEKRNRNLEWTINAIKHANSSTYKEALAAGIIDFIAEDMTDLLKQLHNRTVKLDGKNKILKTASIKAITYEMNWKEKFLNYFAQPQLVMLLFIVAIVGIGIEVKSPGLIVSGVIGGLALIIFLMAVKVLPINIVGLLLLATAVVLFILELNITSYGLLTLGGIAAFIAGSMLLFDSPLPGGHVPLSTIILVLLFILAFIFIVVRAVIKVHKVKTSTGLEGMIGETGIALRDFNGKGKILVHGEIWNAISKEAIKKDDSVIVTESQNMNLTIKKKE